MIAARSFAATAPNASLTDYVVVSQNLPMIEHFARQATGQWVIAASVLDLAGSLHMNSIDCTLRLEEVFDRVIFPPEAEEADEEKPSPATPVAGTDL
ncbi:MAG: hypothetical protein ACREXX_01285 [Gammaproteobacteria bacterium]